MTTTAPDQTPDAPGSARAGSEPIDWGIADLDLDAYLARIGAPRRAPSAAALRVLHIAHVRTIPFENIDTATGTPPALDVAAVAAKLVGRGRGGYCYEHATLFAAAAQRLGYPVRRRIARVRPHRSGPRTHMVLVVTADGVEHLADVGFGAGLWAPMPLVDGARGDHAGWAHRLDRRGPLWLLSRRSGREWEPLHEFDDTEQRPIDFALSHHYTATHPRSPFVGKPVVTRLSEGMCRRLVGDELRVERPDGSARTTPVPPERLGEVLRGLGVELNDDELSRLVTTVSAGPGILTP
ncbi:arylamine N-acetyltransferase family protein [Actinokineospora iranica]|uniref:N-hydroxyarylamine O-acetyltransferase n=1 Tax=Actinokineospora iranica TaxID=1271860 RepID=A0A1G6ISU8_9PSEU|nr:arylamine N-acetyltransferase [Actinokineospora iranica]SDC09503.1 N-hydroxyarylamine O-acetyltransferase [Actinokineospora iranica]